jgi:hypothetical protein
MILDLQQLCIRSRAHIHLLKESVIDILAGYRVRETMENNPEV